MYIIVKVQVILLAQLINEFISPSWVLMVCSLILQLLSKFLHIYNSINSFIHKETMTSASTTGKNCVNILWKKKID